MIPDTFAGRYINRGRLGEGGMGVVFRVHDRLKNTPVALKLVQLNKDQIETYTRSQGMELKLMLAREFRTLASLRHPHIIPVLDYGFYDVAGGEEPAPFYTMQLLEDAQTVVRAARDVGLRDRLQLLGQLLEALAYLHRRNIIHRDLKPGNVLVKDNSVRVLDFGLAVPRDYREEVAGTIIYMAPELLRGHPVSSASDLYGVGVIAFEMLTGEHPFPVLDGGDFLDVMLNNSPDFSWITAPDGELSDEQVLEIRQIIARMMHKNPEQRYQQAEAVLRDLNRLLDWKLEDNAAIRESYLQAAQFVGRDTELKQLWEALQAVPLRGGSLWLVGGESGVGKSRLLDELRIRALVARVRVYRGQAVQEGGVPYQILWDVVRHLVLEVPVADDDARILRMLVPDIEQLLGRSVPPFPVLPAEILQQRLMQAVAGLLRDQQEPLLILLEDLQWAQDSMELLRYLSRMIVEVPVMIAGSYRTDEAPALLLNELQTTGHLKLTRLNDDAVAALMEAMLGEVSSQSEIVSLVKHETEGNAFFIVEVVRALAEEAGHLSQIGRRTLPQRVFARGIQSIVERRLTQVPVWGQGLLQIAAVLGRQIHFPLLETVVQQIQQSPTQTVIREEVAIQDWMMVCAEVAIFRVQDEQWLFSHDKLREGVLAGLSPERERYLHHQAARGIEHYYADDLVPHYTDLAYHYGLAGVTEQERHYCWLAGQDAVSRYVGREALKFLSRALELTDETDYAARFEVLQLRERTANFLALRDNQWDDLVALAELAARLDDDRRRAEVAVRRAEYSEYISDFDVAVISAQQAIDLAQRYQLTEVEARGNFWWGRALRRRGQYREASARNLHALELAEQTGNESLCLLAMRHEGLIATRLADYERSHRYLEESLERAKALGDPRQMAIIYCNLGDLALFEGDHLAQFPLYEKGMALARQVGDRWAEIAAALGFSFAYLLRNQYYRVLQYGQEAERLAVLVNERSIRASALLLQVWGYFSMGDFENARRTGQLAIQFSIALNHQALAGSRVVIAYLNYIEGFYDHGYEHVRLAMEIAEKNEMRFYVAEAYVVQGYVLLGQMKFDAARESFQKMLEMTTRDYIVYNAYAGLASIALTLFDTEGARDYIERLLDFLNVKLPYGIPHPSRLYVLCFKFLNALHDTRARRILMKGYQYMQACADEIDDPDLRQKFLHNIPSNRELADLWQKYNSQSFILPD